MRDARSSSFLILLWWPVDSCALYKDVQTFKDEGMRLYGIRKAGSAIPFLEQAAKAGDGQYEPGRSARRACASMRAVP